MAKYNIVEILKTALRIFGYTVAFAFVGLMFTPILMGGSPFLRMFLVGALIFGVGFLMFSDGSFRGERDCAMSDTLEKLAEKGEYTPSKKEEAQRYYRMKGVWAALIAAAPVVILAIIVAITAKPYVYTVQDLPGWILPYTNRLEIGAAVTYMQVPPPATTMVDYIHVAVRFMLFPYVGFLGTMTDSMSLMFDRVSPLLALIMPAITAIGYQFGPRRRAKNVRLIEQAKNTPRKRLKKSRNRGGGQPPEKKQLI